MKIKMLAGAIALSLCFSGCFSTTSLAIDLAEIAKAAPHEDE